MTKEELIQLPNQAHHLQHHFRSASMNSQASPSRRNCLVFLEEHKCSNYDAGIVLTAKMLWVQYLNLGVFQQRKFLSIFGHH